MSHEDNKDNLLNKDGILLYEPKYISPEESLTLFDTLLIKVPWEQKIINMYDKDIPIPRLTAWFGENSTYYNYSGILNEPQPWLPELIELKNKIELDTGLKFNSCLLNLYRTGKDAISWHADKEKELGLDPCIASISLGSTRSFQVKHKYEKDNKLVINLESGSLVLMLGPMQRHWLHRVAPTTKEVGQRINITFRMIKS